MKRNQHYAVLTGDIVSSSIYRGAEKKAFLEALTSSFRLIESLKPKLVYAPFQIYRGDSFQGVLSDPSYAIRAVIIMRAALRSSQRALAPWQLIDSRIAIGIGQIDAIFSRTTSTGYGEAFQYSGPSLDNMKPHRRLMIKTPWANLNEELDIECGLLDALIETWSYPRAEVMKYRMQDFTQQAISEILKISQPAVNRRLKGAGDQSVDALCERFKLLISREIKRQRNNRTAS
jgi:hypothetical protein